VTPVVLSADEVATAVPNSWRGSCGQSRSAAYSRTPGVADTTSPLPTVCMSLSPSISAPKAGTGQRTGAELASEPAPTHPAAHGCG
jgi:hypothetical protein